MNETLQTILNRRSCKSYLPGQINEDALQLILQAGASSPSAMNQQSPKIVAVQNQEILDILRSIGTALSIKGVDPFYGAPTIVLVFADQTCAYPVEDASLVLGTMFLAATSLGIGSCWINCVKKIFQTKQGKVLQQQLGIAEHYIAVGSCILGNATSEVLSPAKPRKDGYISIIK